MASAAPTFSSQPISLLPLTAATSSQPVNPSSIPPNPLAVNLPQLGIVSQPALPFIQQPPHAMNQQPPPGQARPNYMPIPSDEKFIDRHAWKYKGYPEFTHWMNSSHDFFVLRRFGELNARVLLAMQDKIIAKEARLKWYDDSAKTAWFDEKDKTTWGDSRNDSLGADALRQSGRTALLKEIQDLLKEYNEYFLAYSEIRARHTANDHQVRNVKNWLTTEHPGAIVAEEARFLERRGDLVCIVSRQKLYFRGWIEKWRRLRLARLFRTRLWPDHHVDNPQVHYTSDVGFDVFTNICILLIGLIMLFAPMWWLNWVYDDTKRLAIITCFVFAFTGMLASATSGSRSFEVLAATAAYAAVLMVFMQKSAPTPPSSR